jgi:hypothetical protein
VGYTLFYYLLRHYDTTRIAVISLITPTSSLLVGHVFNAEPLTAAIWTGTALVTLGLVWFEYGTVIAPLLAAARKHRGRSAPAPVIQARPEDVSPGPFRTCPVPHASGPGSAESGHHAPDLRARHPGRAEAPGNSEPP